MEAWIMVNTKAGRQRARENGERIRRVFALGGAVTRIAYTDTVQQAQAFLEKAALEKPDLMVCCGGDGTLSRTVETLEKLGARLPMGFIPMGTTNDFANSLGIAKDPARAAEQILHGSSHFLDLGKFEERTFLYVASFGVFTQTSYNTDQAAKNNLGHLAYVLEGIKELSGVKSSHAVVETDQQVLEGDYLFGAISNSTSLGGVVRLDGQKVDFCDGKIELLLIKMPKNLLEMNRIAFSLMSGKYDPELITFLSVEMARFSFQEPVAWSLDGEFVQGDEQVSVTAMPQAMELVY